MKNTIIVFAIAFLSLSCKEEAHKDYVSFSGKITHKNSSELVLRNRENQTIKTIAVAEDGSFKETIKIAKGKYSLSDGHEYATVFLRPGDQLNHYGLKCHRFINLTKVR